MKLPLLLVAGVVLRRLQRKTRQGLNVVWIIFNNYNQTTVVSSTSSGVHIAGSLHYADMAFDIYPPTDHLPEIKTDVRAKLGPDWDILFHDDHWHFEYDPKG